MMAHGGGGEVRKRKGRRSAQKQKNNAAVQEDEGSSEQLTNSDDISTDNTPQPIIEGKPFHQKPECLEKREIETGSYWLTRIVFIRALGFVYFVAFLVALDQNKGLLGKNGLLPIPDYLSRLRQHYQVPANSSTNLAALSAAPTVMWLVPDEDTDLALDCVAYTGLALSAILIILGAGNAIIFTILWALYHSIVNVGQRWFSFGWESQLLETGFLAIFLSPILSLRSLPRNTPTSWAAVWGYRWLVFRIMLGAMKHFQFVQGLIKIRGDQCWRDLTCMNYHYETQPVPNPISYYLHQSPEIMHQIETMVNHIVELACPFLLLLPRPFRMAGGLIQILFQVIIIISGNLSFLNWLTLIPAILCFDDKALSYLFPSTTRQRVIELQQYWKNSIIRPFSWYVRQATSVALTLLLAYLSIPVIQNMLSSRQVMNTSFDTLRIINTYGAFGSVTKERTEIVLEGTYNVTLGNYGEAADWLEIEFNCKPGAIDRRPCIISPYHYRLDWLMWFAAFQSFQHNPWLLNLAGKILAGDPSVNSLLAHNPFAEKPPKYVRALHYDYQYTAVGSEEASQGQWWTRELRDRLYMPIVSEEHLRPVVEGQGWKWYSPENQN